MIFQAKRAKISIELESAAWQRPYNGHQPQFFCTSLRTQRGVVIASQPTNDSGYQPKVKTNWNFSSNIQPFPTAC